MKKPLAVQVDIRHNTKRSPFAEGIFAIIAPAVYAAGFLFFETRDRPTLARLSIEAIELQAFIRFQITGKRGFHRFPDAVVHKCLTSIPERSVTGEVKCLWSHLFPEVGRLPELYGTHENSATRSGLQTFNIDVEEKLAIGLW